MLTQKQIAQALQISQKTVSRVINGSNSVKPETRERILSFIRDNEYTLNYGARNLRCRTGGTIGVLLSDPSAFNSCYFSQTFRGINEVVNKNGYQLLFTIISGTKDLDTVLTKADAFIIFNISGISRFVPEVLSKINKHKKAKVIIQSTTSGKYPFVSIDNYSGGVTATQHLLNLGHRIISYLCYQKGNEGKQRLNGYLQALENAKLTVKKEWICDLQTCSEADFADKISETPPTERPTAIFCWGDKSARIIVIELQRRGIQTPDNISVIGFDNRIEYVDLNYPKLTTMEQPFYELGIATSEMLFDLLTKKKSYKRQILIEPPLIERESCRAISVS